MWGPPVKKWFISPSNYNVINTINHSEIGVICTNLAILGASHCKSSWTHRFFLVQTPLNHRALERWTVGPGPARRLGILQGVGHRLCHGVIPEQLRLAILMGFLWDFFWAWLDSDGISMDFYGISMGSTESSWLWISMKASLNHEPFESGYHTNHKGAWWDFYGNSDLQNFYGNWWKFDDLYGNWRVL